MIQKMNSYMKKTLSPEACERIYYEALRLVLNNEYAANNGIHPHIEDYRQNVLGGFEPEKFVLHPQELARVYQGVTLDVFKFIEQCYCSRINRSIPMVIELVSLRQETLKSDPISDLAIWTICLFLLEKRDDSVKVSIAYTDTDWMIETIDWQFQIHRNSREEYQPSAVCIIDINQQHILYLQVCKSEELDQAATTALYEALLSQRTPSQQGNAGLIWRLPKKIHSVIEIGPNIPRFLEKVNVEFEFTQDRQIIINKLRGNWEKDLATRRIPQRSFSLILDNFMLRNFGYGPLAARKDMQENYKGLVGFNRDPLWQFPDLRLLFDKVPVRVNANGELKVGSISFKDDLLLHFKNCIVEIIPSPSDTSSIWVYDQHQRVICQARSI